MGLPLAAIFSCGYDPFNLNGGEHSTKLQQAGNDMILHPVDELTPSLLHMAPWSIEAVQTTKNAGQELKRLTSSLSSASRHRCSGNHGAILLPIQCNG